MKNDWLRRILTNQKMVEKANSESKSEATKVYQKQVSKVTAFFGRPPIEKTKSGFFW